MKKRLLSILLSVVLASGAIPAVTIPVQAEETSATSGQCGYSAYWNLSDDGTLSITGSGNLYLTDVPWNHSDESITKVIMDDGITKLPINAFNYCVNLKSVHLPSSLKEIPIGCFSGCHSLKEIDLPDNISSIGYSAFENCRSLESVAIPSGVTILNSDTFSGCSSLQNVEMPDSITDILHYAFIDCSNLKTITIPKSLVYIGIGAFQGCKSLSNLDFSETGLSTIGEAAFDNCTALSSITLSCTVTSIDESAFSRCNALHSVIFHGSPRQFQGITIGEDNDPFTKSQITYDYTAADGISLSDTSLVLNKNSSRSVKLTASLTPDNVTDLYVTWAAESDNIVGIEKDGDDSRTVRIYPINEGTTTITATAKDQDGNDLSAACTVTVESEENYATIDFATFVYPYIAPQSVKKGSKASRPEDPKRDGYTFLGWTASRAGSGAIEDGAEWEEFDFNTSITEDLTLYAVYTSNTCYVYFDPNGGTINGRDYYETSVTKNTVLTDIPTPTRSGYDFGGWLNINTNPWTSFDESKPVTESFRLYALWQSKTVEINCRLACFETEMHRDYQILQINRNDKIPVPETSNVKGYTFVTWSVPYLDKDGNSASYNYDMDKTVGENIKAIQALAERPYDYENSFELIGEMSANQVKVTYHLNGVGGKDVLTTKTAQYDSWIDRDIYPGVPGYAFLGWYTDKECTTQTIDWDSVDDSIDLYAGWLKFADYSTSSSSSTTINKFYNVMIATAQSENGKTEVTEGKDNGTITITTVPSAGYEVDNVRVVGDDGKEISVKKTGANTYSFLVPDGNAAVIATYKKKAMPFTDVMENAYYAEAVEWAVKNNITAGTSATTFSPNDPCKRCEMVMFLWRLSGSPKVIGSTAFQDVPENAYYRDALIWAVKNHITSGTSETTFSPSDTCKRGQMAMFLWRLNGSPETAGNSFKDVNDTDYFKTAVAWLKASGITAGKTKDSYDPNGDCTRGQMVTFLYKYSENE